MTHELISGKIQEVKEEMLRTGLWKKTAPAWVAEYGQQQLNSEHDFSEWLQFVYLPNFFQQVETRAIVLQKNFIVPQAMKFFGEDVKKGKLLQLLIELDSLS